MIITIDDHGQAAVTDQSDLERLKVVSGGQPIQAVSTALESAGLGRALDSAHVGLNIETLRSAPHGRALDPVWLEAFDRMIAFATRSGWVDSEGSVVRAHVEGLA